MSQHAERIVQFFREKIAEFYQTRYTSQDFYPTLNLYDMVVELEKENSDIVSLLIQLLYDAKAMDMHYWILAALRGLASRRKLSSDVLKEVLGATARFAVTDYEEWFKTIGVLAYTPDGICVLLEFVEYKLLKQRDIRNWRWLAFFVVSNVCDRVFIPDSLKRQLKDEVDQESDPDTRKYIQEIAGNL